MLLTGRKPLFPGKNFVHQLQLIFNVLGTPHPEDVAYVTNPNAIEFLEGKKFLSCHGVILTNKKINNISLSVRLSTNVQLYL